MWSYNYNVIIDLQINVYLIGVSYRPCCQYLVTIAFAEKGVQTIFSKMCS